MKNLLSGMGIIFMLLGLSAITQAQYGYPCELEAVRPGSLLSIHRHLRINYHDTDHTLTLIDTQTRAVYQTLSTDAHGFTLAGWSPSCRYIAGNIRTSNGRFFTVWEAETGTQITLIPQVGSRLRWSPDERYIFAHTSNNERRAEMIIDNQTNQYSLLPWSQRHAWDMVNNRIYVIHYRERDAVHAYDLPTGQHIAMYAPTNPDERIFAQSLFLSADRSHIVYYTTVTDNLHIDSSLDTRFDGCAGGFAVWNVWTNTGHTIHTDCRDFPGTDRHRAALSLDNRYFAYGRDIVSVWDLQAIPADASPNWTFAGPDYRIAHLRFLDNQIVETFGYQDYRYALRWNVFTGDYINAFDYQTHTEVARDGSPLGQ